MDKKFRVGIILLLSGILVMLIAIYFRIPNPPTLGEFGAAKNNKSVKALKALYMKLPEVYVKGGDVDIGNTPLEVEVENTPLDVDVSNTPLEVEVSK